MARQLQMSEADAARSVAHDSSTAGDEGFKQIICFFILLLLLLFSTFHKNSFLNEFFVMTVRCFVCLLVCCCQCKRSAREIARE